MKQQSSAQPRYAVPSMALHWVMAFILLALLLVGAVLEDMEPSPQKLQLLLLHKSFGISVLGLWVLRVLFRVVYPAPRLPQGTPLWQVGLAHMAHLALYACMVALPLSGWVMSDAKGYHPALFGWDVLPVLVAPNEFISHAAKEAHEVVASLLWALLGAHVLAAAWHHRVKKDDILRRMLPTWLTSRLPVLALLACVPLGAVQAAAGAPLWTVIPGSSHLKWNVKLDNNTISGRFQDWKAEIAFDPNQLERSSIVVKVNMASVNSGDAERDGTLKGFDFFDVDKNPQALFSSAHIKAAGDGFVAIGNLTLGGVTKPFAIPFKLVITPDGKHARADATLRLSRQAFGVGKGQWKGNSSLADVVNLDVLVTAERP